jgi:hypothetical protein
MADKSCGCLADGRPCAKACGLNMDGFVCEDEAAQLLAEAVKPISNFARVRIKAGWMDAGKQGDFLAGPIKDRKGQRWVVVQWDTDDDPDLHKSTRIELAITEWKAVE